MTPWRLGPAAGGPASLPRQPAHQGSEGPPREGTVQGNTQRVRSAGWGPSDRMRQPQPLHRPPFFCRWAEVPHGVGLWLPAPSAPKPCCRPNHPTAKERQGVFPGHAAGRRQTQSRLAEGARPPQSPSHPRCHVATHTPTPPGCTPGTLWLWGPQAPLLEGWDWPSRPSQGPQAQGSARQCWGNLGGIG